MSDDRDFSDEREEAHERAARALDKIQPAYAQVLATLWVANGGATLAALSFIGAVYKPPEFSRALLLPLWCFVLALISMGIGTGCWLVRARKAIRAREDSLSILDLSPDLIMRPSEAAGLTLRDPRTVSAVVSAALFVLGCAAGLIELSFF